jgi:hypothetical protein
LALGRARNPSIPAAFDCHSRGRSLQRRPDDASASSILKRIDTFVETTQPLIQRYEASGQLVRINALLSIETINAQIQLILRKPILAVETLLWKKFSSKLPKILPSCAKRGALLPEHTKP